jgi:hypothetical protein
MILAEYTGKREDNASHHTKDVKLVEDALPALFIFFHTGSNADGLYKIPIMRQNLADRFDSKNFRRIEFVKTYQGQKLWKY